MISAASGQPSDKKKEIKQFNATASNHFSRSDFNIYFGKNPNITPPPAFPPSFTKKQTGQKITHLDVPARGLLGSMGYLKLLTSGRYIGVISYKL